MSSPRPSRLPVIFGCAGTSLERAERAFFREIRPAGFILFQRNCENPEQVRRLVDQLRDAGGWDDAPVLIDQEGGRVCRLRPPVWRRTPPASAFGALAREDLDLALEAARANARLTAADLHDVGISVNCAPVLDVPGPRMTEAIGDRAFGGDPEIVARLGRAVCEGLMAGGALPVIKHLPGHGRATVDSHHALPRVEASRAELDAVDFAPFRALATMPIAMTAHLLYSAIDPDRPATHSAVVIDEVIRREIGYQGLLLSDDISMQALSGDLTTRARRALGAGCDIVLHCTGVLGEMAEVAAVAPAMSEETWERLQRAMATRRPPDEVDRRQLAARLAELLA
ncbi:MAG: beta-N-acetylhexosaminidase [Alphaproteobacteria bacterium]